MEPGGNVMERKGIGVILMAVCLVFAFSVMPAEAAPKPKPEDTAQRCSDGKDNDEDGLIDDADPDCDPFTGGGGGGGDSDRLTVWFRDDTGGDNLLSDDGGGSLTHANCNGVQSQCYSDGEQKVKAFIDGPPGGIRLELLKSPRGIRLGLNDPNDDDCKDVLENGCASIPPELRNFYVVQTWHVTARAYTDSDRPQKITVTPAAGSEKHYRLRMRFPRLDGTDWIIELGKTRQELSTRCLEEGEDVTVTGLEDTDIPPDGFSDKWLVTAAPPLEPTEGWADPDKDPYNARICSIHQGGNKTPVLVARLKMTFEYTAQLK